jgi:hypothetical protein
MSSVSGIDDVDPEKGKYNNRKINMTSDSSRGIDDMDPEKGKYNSRKINISSVLIVV